MRDYADDPEKKFALSLDEEQEFLERIYSSDRMNWMYPMYAIMLRIGSRLGETLGFTWNDVDFKNRTVFINHQLLYRMMDGEVKLYCENSTKSKSGRRLIPMDDDVYELFCRQREVWMRVKKNRNAKIDGYGNFVFVSPYSKDGLPMNPNKVRKNICTIVDQNKRREDQLPHISPHILRHTACTRMAESGMDFKAIQYIMGHCDVKTTMTIYDHVDLERARREVIKSQKSYTSAPNLHQISCKCENT